MFDFGGVRNRIGRYLLSHSAWWVRHLPASFRTVRFYSVAHEVAESAITNKIGAAKRSPASR